MKNILLLLLIASNSFGQSIPGVTTFSTLAAGNQPLSLLDSSFSAVANYINGAAINAPYYGVKCDGTTDDTTALNLAILSVSQVSPNGGTLSLPAGTCILSSTVSMQKNVSIAGAGAYSTILKFSNTGDGIAMISPKNSSTIVNTSVKNLQILNQNSANTGAAYDDVGGTMVSLSNVATFGFKYGVIFDQTELATISQLSTYYQIAGGAAIWLVNGADHTTGASGGYTNRITVQESEINETTGTYGIADDGGYSHTFSNNNYNGCSVHIRAVAVAPLTVSGSEFEAAASYNIQFATTSLVLGTSLGEAFATVTANQFSTAAGIPAIYVNGAHRLSVSGNVFSGNVTAIQNSASIQYFSSSTNIYNVSLLDGVPGVGVQTDMPGGVLISQGTTPTPGLTIQNANYSGVGVNSSAINFDSPNTSNTQVPFANIAQAIVVPTAGSETGELIISTANSGTLAAKLIVENDGAIVPPSSGGGSLGNSSYPWGSITVSGAITAGGGSTNAATCWKAGGVIGYCSSVVGSGGTCTCN